jgi:hypothetical protein
MSKIICGTSVDDVTPAGMRCLTAEELESVSGGRNTVCVPGQTCEPPTLPCHCPCDNPNCCG